MNLSDNLQETLANYFKKEHNLLYNSDYMSLVFDISGIYIYSDIFPDTKYVLYDELYKYREY